jgi:hypothetical protein
MIYFLEDVWLVQAVEHTATRLQGAALAIVQSLPKWLVWLS